MADVQHNNTQKVAHFTSEVNRRINEERTEVRLNIVSDLIFFSERQIIRKANQEFQNNLPADHKTGIRATWDESRHDSDTGVAPNRH